MNKNTSDLYPWLVSCYEQLINLHNNNKLPNVILFHSTSDLGEQQLASVVAKYLCKHNLDNNNSIYKISSTTAIKIEEVRKVINNNISTSLYGNKSVVIIENIELLTTSAANAILKELETEQSSCYFLLTSNNCHAIPATVLSRCFKVKIAIKLSEDLYTWFAGHNIDDKDLINELLIIANQSPIKALSLFQNNYFEKTQVIDDVFANLSSINMLNCHKTIIKSFSRKDDDGKKKVDYLDFIKYFNYYIYKNHNTKYNHINKMLTQQSKMIESNIPLDYENLLISIMNKYTHECK